MPLGPREIFENFFESFSRDNIFTSMPGIVLAVNEYPDGQTVDVKPAISRLMSTGEVVTNDEIVIYDVPVVLPGGGGGGLTFPIAVGDNVWLDFSMRNIETWLYSDGKREVTPQDSRHYSQADAVAFPCIYTKLNNLKPDADNVELKFGGHLISLAPTGVLTITNGGSLITLNSDSSITANGATITPTGNVITASGTDLDAFYAAYLIHTHSGVTPGGGVTGPPV